MIDLDTSLLVNITFQNHPYCNPCAGGGKRFICCKLNEFELIIHRIIIKSYYKKQLLLLVFFFLHIRWFSYPRRIIFTEPEVQGEYIVLYFQGSLITVFTSKNNKNCSYLYMIKRKTKLYNINAIFLSFWKLKNHIA